MIPHSRPEKNLNDPLPRPLQEICLLPYEENMEFWRIVLRNSDYRLMRMQSHVLYRNTGDSNDDTNGNPGTVRPADSSGPL